MYTFLDGFFGYHQIKIAPEDRHKTAFITDWGAFIWVVMSFGLKNVQPTYHQVINQAFKEYLGDFMKLFLDDLSVYSTTETHLDKLRKCFTKCREFGISLNPKKCCFLVCSGMILGYVVSVEGKFPDPKKIEALITMPRPRNIKDIQVFNGLAQFNRCFIRDYARIMAPITLLTRKDEPFTWTTECNQAFTEIKKRYVNVPILITVNWKLEFHIHTDASDIAIRAMLAQNPALAMVYAINKFRHYLLGNRFVFYVDHMALIYLVNKTQVSGRISRWLLLFLGFDFTVVYKPGKTHGIADTLSRNTIVEPATGITDATSDAQLFSIQPEWLTTVHTSKPEPSLSTGVLSPRKG
jgi:hypothetical protein